MQRFNIYVINYVRLQKVNYFAPSLKPTIIVLLSCFSLLLACGQNENHRVRYKTRFTPNEKGEQIEIIYTDSGIMRAQLVSPVVEHFRKDNPYIEMKKGLSVWFFEHGDLRPSAMLTAQYGIKYELQNQVVLKNKVTVVNLEQDTLETELLIWDELKKSIHSDKPVRIKKKNEILEGVGFESTEDFSQYKIYKITGTFIRDVEN